MRPSRLIREARRHAGQPADDHYGPVRRQYGVNPKVGQRARLQHEGKRSGKEGTVMLPRHDMCHVLVLIDGEPEPLRVHPANVVLLEAAGQTGGEVGNG